MNTAVTIDGAPRSLEPWFRRVEAALTRFVPESPLSQLNRFQERWVVVPPLLFKALRAALAAARLTGGAFDPTVLDAMEAAGYSRSFDLGPTPPSAPLPAGRWREVRLAPEFSGVWLPAGVRIDLGGIGKGLAVDGAVARLRAEPRAIVNAGGDLAVKTAPGDPPVLVEVEDPFQPGQVLAQVRVEQGAAATSGTLARRWGPGLHHIIDPVTGRSAASGVVQATVFTARAAKAEVLAKAAVVLGPERGLALLLAQGAHGLLVCSNGELMMTPGLEAYRHVTA
ncbi:MAG TPA: FAD:protein FMN transferase [Symbiobacteriaceae bacterium]|nr:FAD:protein FMN transferase [Symbiobacteriaceae bacterium]